jgi:hypothetical protein
VLLGFLKLRHLTGITATCLFPGFLCGIEGLSRLVLGATVLREPTILAVIVGSERSICRVAPFAILGRTALLGGLLYRNSPFACASWACAQPLWRLLQPWSCWLWLSRAGLSTQVGGVTR